MDRLLLVWTNEQEIKTDVTNIAIIKDKARQYLRNRNNKLQSFKFQEFIETEVYRQQQIFNYDLTGLFWKRMPNRTYITKDEKSIPGHKPMNDRLKLLLGTYNSDDMKLKPLLISHSENP
ncbi:hypothetical protein RF11_13548 [Thelohanellus kitauei]|uniref:Uncharacterized protein n=1 Tax=Thelohanellus kitauei TaxID=669202 RepID=A0A0C2JWU1_THEKT|nr:hypothetical protein RF11_13548 [Thelohanellus kitauei]